MANKPDIIEEKEMAMFQVKDQLARIKAEDKESNFRIQKTEEYLNTFSFLKPEEYQKLVEKLQKLEIPRLADKHIFKIADILPKTIDELKVVMQGYPLTISNDNIKKIVATLNEFLPDIKKKE